MTEDEQSPVGSPETESLEDIIRKFLLTPSDQDLLIQRLMGAIRSSQPVVQERLRLTDLEIMLQNWLLVGTVTEEDVLEPLEHSVPEIACVVYIIQSLILFQL